MSSFIERFSIAGSAGVLALMVVLGVYGFASLWTAEPDESWPPGSEEFLVLEGQGIPIGSQVFRPQVSPAAEPGEPPPAELASLETPGAADAALFELEPVVLTEALSGGSVDGPAVPAAATPAPAPAHTAVANTPAPAPDPAPPTTPEPTAPTPTAPATPAPEPTIPPLPTPDPTVPTP